ncbi:hypothetical protein OS493_003885 [Desmophyllum pertusum]|uniref:Uncharacterized protein n=1 Tax=Desmophyllum pertusum TaxID=174260 RepID=A0A9W9ZSJ4_9CNID|nr:hypothetical protein OS493_003885 [Desmophyllum pertusum]
MTVPECPLYHGFIEGNVFRRLVATYAFSRIIKTKTDDRGETRWLFKGMDLTNEEELLPQVLTSLFYLFLVFFSGVVSTFYQLLLLDVNYRCEGNEKTQDCFKLSFFESSIREPIDCNSAAVQNGTIDVVCYKIVFNFGLAVGASYGGFQLSMVFLNMATSAMLMAKQAKTIRNIRIVLGLLSLCLFAALMAVQFTSPQLFITDNLVITLQALYQWCLWLVLCSESLGRSLSHLRQRITIQPLVCDLCEQVLI